MNNPRRDSVLSIAPTSDGEAWEVLHLTNHGVLRERFVSQEDAMSFVHMIPSTSLPEHVMRRRNTIKDHLEKEVTHHSRVARRRAFIFTVVSFVLMGLAGGVLFSTLDHQSRDLDYWITIGFSLFCVASLALANIVNFRMISTQQRADQIMVRNLRNDWSSRAWAAASADIHIEPSRPHPQRPPGSKAPNENLEKSN